MQDLLHQTTKNLEHAKDQMLLLGRKISLERVTAFLIEMGRRLAATGAMERPMRRPDIVDYLGLTLEKVSRAPRGCETRIGSSWWFAAQSWVRRSASAR
jgi:CRP/FNR family nitrogen fixation transcriptional regulator